MTIQHEANLEKVSATIAFTKEFLEVVEGEGSDFLEDKLRAIMTGYVLAGLPRDVTAELEYPASWWQYTKRTILEGPLTPLGKWLRSRFPPRMKTIEHTETFYRRICPHDPLEDDPSKHFQWVAGPEIYTNQIEELEKAVEHWRLRARAFEKRNEIDRDTLAKQAGIIRRGFGQ